MMHAVLRNASERHSRTTDHKSIGSLSSSRFCKLFAYRFSAYLVVQYFSENVDPSNKIFPQGVCLARNRFEAAKTCVYANMDKIPAKQLFVILTKKNDDNNCGASLSSHVN